MNILSSSKENIRGAVETATSANGEAEPASIHLQIAVMTVASTGDAVEKAKTEKRAMDKKVTKEADIAKVQANAPRAAADTAGTEVTPVLDKIAVKIQKLIKETKKEAEIAKGYAFAARIDAELAMASRKRALEAVEFVKAQKKADEIRHEVRIGHFMLNAETYQVPGIGEVVIGNARDYPMEANSKFNHLLSSDQGFLAVNKGKIIGYLTGSNQTSVEILEVGKTANRFKLDDVRTFNDSHKYNLNTILFFHALDKAKQVGDIFSLGFQESSTSYKYTGVIAFYSELSKILSQCGVKVFERTTSSGGYDGDVYMYVSRSDRYISYDAQDFEIEKAVGLL